MPQENVEVAREAFARLQTGDPAWSEWVHPEIEWDFSGNPLADLPNRGRGRDAILVHVWTVRGRKRVYWRTYPDRQSALAAVGLPE